jgi:hypothetical protein
MRMGAALAAAVAVATVAGCGGGNGGSTSTSGQATISSLTQPCRAGQLGVAAGQGGVGAGNATTPFGISNRSGRPCRLRGFPRVVLLDGNGHAMSPTAKPRSADYFGNVPVRTVTVPANGKASFRLAYQTATGTGKCVSPQSLRVSWPGSSGALRSVVANQHVCANGISVSPFAPGHSAWAG